MADGANWSTAALSVVCAAGWFFIARYTTRNRNEGPFPPGPKPRFLIGNALDIPFQKPAQTYLEWSKRFQSDILHMYALGFRIMVLNSREDAEELLDRRAAVYSDRPNFPTLDLIGWDYNVASLRYDEPWRHRRRICQQHFKEQTVYQFHPIIIRKIHDMLAGLLDTPTRFKDHNKMLSISIPLTIMYGYEVKSLDDPAILAADESMELGAMVISPGGSLANVFPLFKYIPWTWTQKVSKEVRYLTSEAKRIPMEALERDMENGTAIPSFMGSFLEKKATIGATDEEEQAMLDIAITVYVGASDTTISSTGTFFYHLSVNPQIQAKAQAQLDQVLGSPPRLPTFEDRPSLPYIEAIYREVLRWCPPLPNCAPHANTEDDWYKGYLIPKGTAIWANIWAMNRDEKRYGPDSHEFNPDRFFDEHGNLNDDDRVLAYGFGRRVCVGKHMASDTLWLTFASVLACFTLSRPKDEHGNEIDINHEFEDEGVFARKVPFECDVKPRSDAWRDLIEAIRNTGYQF